MKLAELEKLDGDFLTADQVADVLGLAPQNIRSQARDDAGKLGFPVIVCSTRVVIPKEGFLNFCKGGDVRGT